MVYGLMADLHLHPWTAFATERDGMNSRLAGLLGEIRRCAAEVNVASGAPRGGLIVLAGDVFHVRGAVRPTVLNALKDVLLSCNQEFGTVFEILAGNHDLEGRDATRLGSAVTALECGYVQIINQSVYQADRVMIPWFENVEALKEEIQRWAPKVGDTERDLILHAPIDGVIAGLPAHGLTGEWLSGLNFRRVFAGHYHDHKLVYDNTVLAPPGCIPEPCQVYSIGALAHHTWSDVGTRAGFLLIDDEAVNYRASHLPHFIDLGQLTEVEPDEVPLLVDQNYVRIKVEAAKSKDVEDARAELMGMGAKGVLVQPLPKIALKPGEGRATVVASGASLEVSVAGFVKAMTGVDLDRVNKAAQEVLAAAGVEA